MILLIYKSFAVFGDQSPSPVTREAQPARYLLR
jgi:hypothetical protein